MNDYAFILDPEVDSRLLENDKDIEWWCKICKEWHPWLEEETSSSKLGCPACKTTYKVKGW
jgi:hypothetical protein